MRGTMAYVKTENGTVAKYPVDQEYVRWNSGNVSFPAGNIPDHIMAEFNCHPVETVAVSFDANTKRAVEADPVFIDGKWAQTWNIVDLTPDEIAQRNAEQWAIIRDERNTLLAACDWTQLPDAPVSSSEWAAYRQALRDITTQLDPFDILWPATP